MSNIQTTVSLIRDHGCRAMPTQDGLLAVSSARWIDPPLAEMDDDRDFDVIEVFEHDENGDVSVAAVRRWLGY